MSVQLATQSQAASDILTKIKSRLVAGLSPGNTSYVRILARPNPDYADYKAEEGVAVIIHTATPFPMSGAGRGGYYVRRTIEIHVATMSMLDQAGSDDIAVKAQCDLEESVVNLLQSYPPTYDPDTDLAGLQLKWIPGGREIERQVKVDPAMLFSALLFEVQYVVAIQTVRA